MLKLLMSWTLMVFVIIAIGAVMASNAKQMQVVKPPGFSITLIVDVNQTMPAAIECATVSSSESLISIPIIVAIQRLPGTEIPKCYESEAGNRILAAQLDLTYVKNVTTKTECTARSGSIERLTGA